MLKKAIMTSQEQETITVTKLIDDLRSVNGNLTFDILREELKKKNDDGSPKYYLSMKDNDDLFILYYDNLPKINTILHSKYADQLEKNTRSCILEKDTLKIIATQFNRIIYNNDAKEFMKDKDWENIIIEKCYEGTILLVYNHKNKWYISTRRCLDASESTWVKNKSYEEMFYECINDKFKLDDLDKDNCYYFVLLHHKNKNIINYSQLGFGTLYNEVIHVMTTKKYTLEEIDYDMNAKKPEIMTFSNMDELLKSLDVISKDNEAKKTITMEGYIIKYYSGQVKKSQFTVLKLQTDIYQKLIKVKPNNSNMHQSYLELYQNDKLGEYLPYFSKYHSDIINRIDTSIKTLSQEVLDIYHGTRQKKNPEVYNALKDQYKKTIYGLHGLFINFRTPNFKKCKDKNKDKDKNLRSITVHDVYHHLKQLPSQQLRQLLYERTFMENDSMFEQFINKECLDITTLTTLMFQNIKKTKLDNSEEKDNIVEVVVSPP